jgi:colanic acid/amylovoran biosynthesis glycosyltransferase
MHQQRIPQAAHNRSTKRVAYVVSRFPRISETFILYEILELERLGLQVDVFPLVRQSEQVMHAEAQAIVDRAHYTHIISWAVLAAQIYWLLKRPTGYIRAWWNALIGNITSPKFLLRALIVVPQAALLARRMQALGVEHIHAHWATHPTLAAYVIQRLTELRYSFTAHAHDIYVERPMLDEKIRNASFVVTISEYNRRLLQTLYGKEAGDKTLVIHCGVDPDIFQPQTKSHSNDSFTIVCVASLEEKKGHPYLIDACAQLMTQGVDFRCLLIGDGEARPHIEAQIARLGLSDRITLLGRQPRDRVSTLVAQADVVVLPSIVTDTGKQEGIPVALMEALATERPVVATAISGVPELIEHEQTGLLVQERDATAIAAALIRLYESPEFGKQLGTAGRAKVLKEFNLRDNAAALYKLLIQDWASTSVDDPQVLYALDAEGKTV